MDLFKKFLDSYHVKRIPKGEIILCQGEVPEVVYVVKRGVIKTYNITAQGEEKPLSFDAYLELFPTAWTFRKTTMALYYYEAFTACEVYLVPREDFLDFLFKNQAAMNSYFDYFINKYLNFQMQVNALEQSKASLKIINTLHVLCLRFGKEVGPDRVQIQLPLTQQDLANFMGLTRETTGIELKKLQRQGVLSYRRQNYTVHTDKLNDLLDEDYDQSKLKNGPDQLLL